MGYAKQCNATRSSTGTVSHLKDSSVQYATHHHKHSRQLEECMPCFLDWRKSQLKGQKLRQPLQLQVERAVQSLPCELFGSIEKAQWMQQRS